MPSARLVQLTQLNVSWSLFLQYLSHAANNVQCLEVFLATPQNNFHILRALSCSIAEDMFCTAGQTYKLSNPTTPCAGGC